MTINKSGAKMIDKVITPNVIRTLQKIKADPSTHMLDLLVDENFHPDLLALLNTTPEGEDSKVFSLRDEFADTYSILKTMLNALAASPEKSTDDLKILNSAQKFLEFILKNEIALNGIDSVKTFKTAVFEVLDESSPETKDKVITKLNELVDA